MSSEHDGNGIEHDHCRANDLESVRETTTTVVSAT